jgi:hypothetical protein
MAIWQNPTIDALMALSWGVSRVCSSRPTSMVFCGRVPQGWCMVRLCIRVLSHGYRPFDRAAKVGYDFGKVFMPGIGAIAILVSLVTVPLVSLVSKKYAESHVNTVLKQTSRM